MKDTFIATSGMPGTTDFQAMMFTLGSEVAKSSMDLAFMAKKAAKLYAMTEEGRGAYMANCGAFNWGDLVDAAESDTFKEICRKIGLEVVWIGSTSCWVDMDEQLMGNMEAYVIGQIGAEMCQEITDGMSRRQMATFFSHTYRAMKDYGLSVYDSDKWAWLNTLFGYDIGADRAIGLIRWHDGNDMDVMELGADDKEQLMAVAKELGYHFNFSGFPDKDPDAISYTWPEHL